MTVDFDPYVTIERTGRWSWTLEYHTCRWDPFVNLAYVFGSRAHAQRVADRKIRREKKRHAWKTAEA
jgi:hypothetical protein